MSARFAQKPRKQRRNPAQHQEGYQHFGRESEREQLQLRVQAAQQGERNIHEDQQRDYRKREPYADREERRAETDERFRRFEVEEIHTRRDASQAFGEDTEHL